MKKNIHPTYYEDATVVCACGNTFTTGSTRKTIQVEVCHRCHPYYTGQHRYLDIKGRVDLFQKKVEKAKQYKMTAAPKKKEKKEEKQPKTLRELLEAL